jgi:Protein of unknown function (DUF2782)
MSRLSVLLAVCVLAGVLSPAFAADAPKPPRPPNLEKVDDIPPPPNTLIDPKVKPQETIREDGDKKIVEYRMNGRLYKMRVILPNGSSYWLVDPKGEGKFVQDEKGIGTSNSVPMWVVYEW